MKISIALATYNGAKYLTDQLASFAFQTRLPDELIVCDDLSNDKSIEILNSFADTSPFPVRIVRNEQNLGITRNFEKALSLCVGDLIFLSDQDDVWDKEKLSIVSSIFEKYPDFNVIINDAMYTDENLVPAGLTVLQKVLNFSGRKKDHIAGCSTAITKQFRDFILPFPKNNCPAHDAYIHRWANLLDTKIVIGNVLQSWRIHGENNSDSEMNNANAISKAMLYKKYKNVNVSAEYLQKANEFREMDKLILERDGALSRLLLGQNADALRSEIRRVIDAHESRARLSEANWFQRKAIITSMVFKGHYKYFRGIKSFAKDFLK